MRLTRGRRGRLVLLAALALLGLFLLRVAAWRPLALVGEPPGDGYARAAGVVHVHTTLSDGGGTPEEVIRAARATGLDFLGITDHNNLDAKPFEGYHDGVLVLVGVGALDARRPPRSASGSTATPPWRFYGDGLDALEDVRDLGGDPVRRAPVLGARRPALERLGPPRAVGDRAPERRQRRPPRGPARPAHGRALPPQPGLRPPPGPPCPRGGPPPLGRDAREAGRRRARGLRRPQPARRSRSGGRSASRPTSPSSRRPGTTCSSIARSAGTPWPTARRSWTRSGGAASTSASTRSLRPTASGSRWRRARGSASRWATTSSPARACAPWPAGGCPRARASCCSATAGRWGRGASASTRPCPARASTASRPACRAGPCPG